MTADFSIGAVVIGAGAVGLAVARALARAGRDVVILEKNARIGEETSARNIEVIHAGLGELVDLFGMENPGLTAPLAFAGKVEGMLRDA